MIYAALYCCCINMEKEIVNKSDIIREAWCKIWSPVDFFVPFLELLCKYFNIDISCHKDDTEIINLIINASKRFPTDKHKQFKKCMKIIKRARNSASHLMSDMSSELHLEAIKSVYILKDIIEEYSNQNNEVYKNKLCDILCICIKKHDRLFVKQCKTIVRTSHADRAKSEIFRTKRCSNYPECPNGYKCSFWHPGHPEPEPQETFTPPIMNGDKNMTPSGRPSKYCYMYLHPITKKPYKQACLGDIVIYNGTKYKLLAVHGGTDINDPEVILNGTILKPKISSIVLANDDKNNI